VEFLDPTDPDGMHRSLCKWCASHAGEYQHVFDNPQDTIASRYGATALLAFDMTHALVDPVVRAPLTQYLFHLVEQLLDGRRLVVWLDEFAKLVGDPAFEALAKDGLKTWRKRNGVIAFATQSPSDVTDSPIARTVIEQTPTKLFFPNHDASHADYVDAFGLSEREFRLVVSGLAATPHGFLIKQSYESLIAVLDLAGLDPELKVLSSRTETIAELEILMARHGADPACWLPPFLMSTTGAKS
jgi:type IV secretion system protein VirB4